MLAGAPLVYWAAKITAGEVYGISPYDPLTIAAAVLVIVLVCTLAGFLPARRATGVDPMQALRYD